nr:hypothetical protein [Tanacetum cinerariifolium]
GRLRQNGALEKAYGCVGGARRAADVVSVINAAPNDRGNACPIIRARVDH